MTWLTNRLLRDPEQPFVSDMPLYDSKGPFVPPAAVERFGGHSRQGEVARIAYRNGEAQGFGDGYLRGAKVGTITGAILGALIVCLLMWASHRLWPIVERWLAS